MSYALNYEGLKERETYDEIIDYIQNHQDKIKFPNRVAKQLRDTPQLSNLLDGEGHGVSDLEQQQKDQTILTEREHRLREKASQTNQSTSTLRVNEPAPIDVEQFNIASDSSDDGGDDVVEVYDNAEAEAERARTERTAKTKTTVLKMLGSAGHMLGSSSVFVGKGVYYIGSGIAKGVGSHLPSTDVPSSDDEAVDTGNYSIAGSSNDDLHNKVVAELRQELRGLNNASGRSIAGRDISKMGRANVISEIVRLRG